MAYDQAVADAIAENRQLRDANWRLQERAAELSSRLEGALTALREIQQVVPPRDWTRYAQAVLDNEAARPHRMILKTPNAK